jgi:hypothetical protein
MVGLGIELLNFLGAFFLLSRISSIRAYSLPEKASPETHHSHYSKGEDKKLLRLEIKISMTKFGQGNIGKKNSSGKRIVRLLT